MLTPRPRHAKADSKTTIGWPVGITMGRAQERRMIDEGAASHQPAFILANLQNILFILLGLLPCQPAIALGPFVAPFVGIAIQVEDPQVIRLEQSARPDM